ncbi:MAG: hypothetical protein KIT79_14730 [Deltaproteobacteria bacterium]|nr:hypothetical protein [Deltaproteobacteria bacterium]
MNPLSKAFIGTALLVHVLASLLGAALAVDNPYALQLRYVHTHGQTIGFVAFLIYGVSYHIFPRFQGRPLRYPGLGWLHYGLAVTGLLLLWLGRTTGAIPAQLAGGVISAAGVLVFAFNIGSVIFGRRP